MSTPDDSLGRPTEGDADRLNPSQFHTHMWYQFCCSRACSKKLHFEHEYTTEDTNVKEIDEVPIMEQWRRTFTNFMIVLHLKTINRNSEKGEACEIELHRTQ